MLCERLAASPPDGDWAAHFRALAELLLRATTLRIAGQVHELCEIEFYLDAPGHRDPFTHRSEGQRSAGRWYFHRAGGSYRGGSFKGLDISFGPGESHGGVLIRSLRKPDGALVNGSSLCVDHMLALTAAASVAELDAQIDARPVDDPSSPLALVPRPQPGDATETAGTDAARVEIWASARVGLTLKRLAEHPSMPAYLARPYRFLTDPRAIKKGRLQLILALHQADHDSAAIRALCGSPRASIEAAIERFEAGRRSNASELGELELAELYGKLASAGPAGAELRA